MKHEDVSQLDPTLVAALRHLHYGLYLLTTGEMTDPRGMLVSWVSQVGGDPPLIMCAVRHNRMLLPELEKRHAFAINLLPEGDVGLLGELSRPGPRRFEGLELVEGPLGLPALADCPGAVFCEVLERYQPGDHIMLVGRVAGSMWQGPGPVMTAGTGGHTYLGLR